MAHSPATVQLWLNRICGHEGGFTDNPKDDGNWTGGRQGVGVLKGTKWGIAASAHPHLDIKSLTVADAEAIYREEYLKPIQADNFEDGVAFQLLDFAVNSGPSTGKKELQQALGVVPDGVIGPATIAAAKKISEARLIMLLAAERLEFMTKARRWPEFGAGWCNRMAQNLRYGAEDV